MIIVYTSSGVHQGASDCNAKRLDCIYCMSDSAVRRRLVATGFGKFGNVRNFQSEKNHTNIYKEERFVQQD